MTEKFAAGLSRAETQASAHLLQQRIAGSIEEVEQGRGSYVAPRNAPELYPGDRPETTGFFVDASKGMVNGARWNQDSTLWVNRGKFDPVIDIVSLDGTNKTLRIDDYLEQNGAPKLENRYLLTVFGSNRNPGQLEDKFRKKLDKAVENGADPEAMAKELLYIPAFNGLLKGYDAVYNRTLGNMGYGYADLYTGPETEQTEIEVSVLFLTQAQIDVIHDSEKDYDFAYLGDVKMGSLLYDDTPGYDAFEDAQTLPAFCHIGKAGVYVLPDESGERRPVALSEVYARNRGLREESQTGFQAIHIANGDAGKKGEALAIVQELRDRGVRTKKDIEGLDLDNLPEDIIEVAISRATALTPEAYRQNIKAGGELGSLGLRRLFKRLLNQQTPEEYTKIVDASEADKTTVIPRDKRLPTWGELEAA